MPPAFWKRPSLEAFRRRKSGGPRLSWGRRNKQKIEHPDSPSSILQIEEIQHHEVPEQPREVVVPMDDEISRLSMPSLIEDDAARAADGVAVVSEERSLEAGTAMKNEKHLKIPESYSQERLRPEEDNCLEEVVMKVSSSDGSTLAENEQPVEDRESITPCDRQVESSSENLKSEDANRVDKVDVTMPSSDGFMTYEKELPVEDTVPITYNSPIEFPAKSMDLIGRRVKVRESLSDARKRGKIGTVTGWKDGITITMECDDGASIRIRVANIDFVEKSDGQPPFQSESTQDRIEMPKTTIDQEDPILYSGVDSISTFRYKSPTEVPGNCPAIIGKHVKVRDSLSDSAKRGKIGMIVEWKTRNTVTLKCEDGQSFGVRLSSIDFVNQQTQSNFSQRPLNTVNQNSNTCLDETPSCRISDSFQIANSNSTEMLVTAQVNVNESDVSDSNIGVESNPGSRPYGKEEAEALDKIIVPEKKLTEAPSATENDPVFRYKNPIEVPANDELMIRRRVKVKDSLRDSKKRGKFGVVVRWKNRSTVEVLCDDGSKFGVQLDSIHFTHGNELQEQSHAGKNFTSTTRPVSQTSTRRITRNSEATKPKTQSRREPRRNRKSPKEGDQLPPDVCSAWIAPQNPLAAPKFGAFRVEKLVVRKDEYGETTFLNNVLKERKLVVDVPLSGSLATKSIEKRVKDKSGNVHELVSCKTYEESSGFKFAKRKVARVIYAQTQGPDLEPFAVDEYLLRLGDFTTIPPRKIAARLELFQSPSSLGIVSHEDDSWFQRIPDLGYVGGGFIHEDTLLDVLKRAGMGEAGAKRVAAVQVRIFVPSMGIFKGMLVKKRTRNGAPIELPCSMQKVLESSHPQRFEGSSILICRGKVHPSPGSTNEFIGRKLSKERKPPPPKTFKADIKKKPLTQMIFRLWETMGVPKDICERYRKESVLPDRRNHAWLVGVPDPTGCLPPDTVFVPGMKDQGACNFFVTRCPCYAHEHGRKFHSLTQKPLGMSSDDWDWLNNFSFGVIIFSNPRPGMMSIPERIANGDLDGDLYLVCWDKEVVECMSAHPLVDQPAEDNGKLSTVPSNPHWFDEAQDVMIENLKFEMSSLIGALYKLAEKIANKSEQKLNDPDALALFEAYNQALEYHKHGRPICLPRHLIEQLKPKLRPLVQPVD